MVNVLSARWCACGIFESSLSRTSTKISHKFKMGIINFFCTSRSVPTSEDMKAKFSSLSVKRLSVYGDVKQQQIAATHFGSEILGTQL